MSRLLLCVLLLGIMAYISASAINTNTGDKTSDNINNNDYVLTDNIHRHIRFERHIIDTTQHPQHNFKAQSSNSKNDKPISIDTKRGYLIHYEPPLSNELKVEIESLIGTKLNHYYPSNTYLI